MVNVAGVYKGMKMDITNCSKEELAQAVLELTIELGKTRRALNAALEVGKTPNPVDKVYEVKSDRWKLSEKPRYEWEAKLPTLDPMAVDPRSVV